MAAESIRQSCPTILRDFAGPDALAEPGGTWNRPANASWPGLWFFWCSSWVAWVLSTSASSSSTDMNLSVQVYTILDLFSEPPKEHRHKRDQILISSESSFHSYCSSTRLCDACVDYENACIKWFSTVASSAFTKTRRCGRWKLDNEEAVLSTSFIHTYRTSSPFGGYACLDFATNEWPMKACVICTDKTSTLTHVVNKLIIVTDDSPCTALPSGHTSILIVCKIVSVINGET